MCLNDQFVFLLLLDRIQSITNHLSACDLTDNFLNFELCGEGDVSRNHSIDVQRDFAQSLVDL